MIWNLVLSSMKKILLLLATIAIVSCVGCHEKGRNFQLTYRVYYPGTVVEKTVYPSEEIYLGSDRGTNYLKYYDENGEYHSEVTSAPIQIVNYYKLKKE